MAETIDNRIHQILNALRNGFSVEITHVDVKSKWYSDDPKGMDELCKDVSAMANNGGQDPSLIVFGLSEKEPYLLGAALPLDESDIQQKIRSRVDPHPPLRLHCLNVEDTTLFALEVAGRTKDLPYVTGDRDGRHRVWIRRGSSTETARHAELVALFEKRFDATLRSTIEANAVNAIRQIRAGLQGAGWEDRLQLLDQLNAYTEPYNPRLTLEILEVLSTAASDLRNDAPADVAWKLYHLAFGILPLWSLRRRAVKPLRANEWDLLQKALSLAFDMTYDGARWLRSEGTVGAGTQLLWALLRYATLNDPEEFQVRVVQEFDRLIRTSKEARFDDAVRWLEFMKHDSLAVHEPLPRFPEDLARRFSGPSDPTL